jgi:hypothetical protein
LILSGILNFALIVFFANSFSIKYGLKLAHNIFVLAGIYLFAFLLPHVMYVLKYRKIGVV